MAAGHKSFHVDRRRVSSCCAAERARGTRLLLRAHGLPLEDAIVVVAEEDSEVGRPAVGGVNIQACPAGAAEKIESRQRASPGEEGTAPFALDASMLSSGTGRRAVLLTRRQRVGAGSPLMG